MEAVAGLFGLVWVFLSWPIKFIYRHLHLIKQVENEAEQQGSVWSKNHIESIKMQLALETDPERKQALEKELQGAIAVERAYSKDMLERCLQRSGMPPYEALRARDEPILEPENMAKMGEALKNLSILPPSLTPSDYMVRASGRSLLGQYEEALEDLNYLLQLSPDDPIALINRGGVNYKLNRLEAALDDTDHALKLKPNDEKGLVNRAVVYDAMGRYDEALEDFNCALQLEPKDYIALTGRGATYFNMGRHDEALQDLNQALQYGPNDLYALNNRGITYMYLKQYDKALVDFDHALRLKPDFDSVLYNKACLYSFKSKPDDAINYLKQAIGLDEKWRHKAASETDFDNIWDDPRFKTIIEES